MLTLRKHELPGRDVFEIMKGKYREAHWLDDSIYLTEDVLMQTELKDLLEQTVPFNYYGPTEIDRNAWESIRQKALTSSDLTRQLIAEIDAWARKCFENETCFTICGP
jgi:hypothetical protein